MFEVLLVNPLLSIFLLCLMLYVIFEVVFDLWTTTPKKYYTRRVRTNV